jgi:outer membrane protein assembly factor BamD (BamD/ComL family)
MNNFLNKTFLLITLVVLFLLSACASTINISENLSAAELIQRGQEALDRNRYNVAIQFYQALHDRNRNNIDLVITAEYHIANIHYKQGRFAQAREGLNAVLEYYNTPDEELLPQHFKRLSQIVLQNIEVKERQRRPFSRR